MDKVQSGDEVQSVPDTEKQKKEAETQEKELKMQHKDPMKCKRETQEVRYAIKGYWIKEKKKVKVNGGRKGSYCD